MKKRIQEINSCIFELEISEIVFKLRLSFFIGKNGVKDSNNVCIYSVKIYIPKKDLDPFTGTLSS